MSDTDAILPNVKVFWIGVSCVLREEQGVSIEWIERIDRTYRERPLNLSENTTHHILLTSSPAQEKPSRRSIAETNYARVDVS